MASFLNDALTAIQQEKARKSNVAMTLMQMKVQQQQRKVERLNEMERFYQNKMDAALEDAENLQKDFAKYGVISESLNNLKNAGKPTADGKQVLGITVNKKTDDVQSMKRNLGKLKQGLDAIRMAKMSSIAEMSKLAEQAGIDIGLNREKIQSETALREAQTSTTYKQGNLYDSQAEYYDKLPQDKESSSIMAAWGQEKKSAAADLNQYLENIQNRAIPEQILEPENTTGFKGFSKSLVSDATPKVTRGRVNKAVIDILEGTKNAKDVLSDYTIEYTGPNEEGEIETKTRTISSLMEMSKRMENNGNEDKYFVNNAILNFLRANRQVLQDVNWKNWSIDDEKQNIEYLGMLLDAEPHLRRAESAEAGLYDLMYKVDQSRVIDRMNEENKEGK